MWQKIKDFFRELLYKVIYFFGWCGFQLLYGVGHRYRVHRRDRKKALKGRKQGVLIVANHASFLDPGIVGIIFFHRIWYLARQSLFDNKSFAWLITAVGALPISREKLDLATLRQVKTYIEKGRDVLLFPEGTRTEDGELQPGQAGVGFFADKVKADILPVYVKGSFESWPKGGKYHFAKLDSIVGELIPYEYWQTLPQGRERYQMIADGIMEKMAELKKELEEIKK